MQPFTVVPQMAPVVPEEEEEDDDDYTTFDPRHREAFTGLLFLGHLRKRVIKYGHSFTLKTPTHRERIEAGVLHKKYVNTIAGEIAWSALTVAMYLEAVDDQALPEPIGPAVETHVEDRFNWVVDNIKGEVITRLFEECLLLDDQVANSLRELEASSKRSG